MASKFLTIIFVSSFLFACQQEAATPVVPPPVNPVAPAEPAAALGRMDLDPAVRTKAESACLQTGTQMVIEIAGKDFKAAVSRFTPALAKDLTAETLSSGWLQMATGHAGFKGIKRGWAETFAQQTVAYVPMEFANGKFDAKIACDGASKVAGLWFIGHTPKWSAPKWDNTAKYDEVQVTVGAAPWQLPGTVTKPKGEGPFPGVVLVHGTGPNDRDGTIGPTKLFRDLAIGLALRGVATLRYEKRTRFYAEQLSRGAVGGLDLDQETVTDAAAAAATLRARPEIKAVYLLGHDLGGFAIPRIASTAGELAGVIIAAGLARPLDEADLDQARHLFSLDGLTDEEKGRVAEIEARVKRVRDGLSADVKAEDLPMGLPRSYWENVKSYEPAKAAAALTVPIRLMHAGRDYHATHKDLALWKSALAGKSNFSVIEYAGLNHNFMAPPTGQLTTPAKPGEYIERAHVDAKVFDDLSAFVSGN